MLGHYAGDPSYVKDGWFDNLTAAVEAAADRLRAEHADRAAATLLELMGVPS